MKNSKKLNKYRDSNFNKESTTQKGILNIVEKIVRCHPLLYLISRSIIRFTNIFEIDFEGLKLVNLGKKLIIYDIGASDGIASKFFLNNLYVKKIYCFEPDQNFVKILKDFKNKKIIIKPYGIGLKNFKSFIFMPRYNFFGKNYDFTTYSFFNKKNLEKQIDLDFKYKNKISIIKKTINIRKYHSKEKIHLIKIDTNGYEYQIIKTLRKIINYSRPVIILETNENISRIRSLLKKLLYTPYYYDNKSKELKKVKNQYPLNTFFLQKKHIKI